MPVRRYIPPGQSRLAVLCGPRLCPACGGPTEVTAWLPRGFLKSVCRPCRRDYSLTHTEFLDSRAFDAIPCPACRQPLQPRISEQEGGNYVLDCDACDHYIRLADLLPVWKPLPRRSFISR